MSQESERGERFFLYFPWLILVTVIASFGAKAVFDADGLPPLTPLHHFHAVAMLAWFFLFALQPTLIHSGRVSLHRRLGQFSPLIVLAFIGFAIPISLLNWGRMGDPLIITANGVNLTLFLGLYISAIVYRRRADTHKRLMTYATLTLMGPAFGRIPEIFDQSPVLAVPFVFGYMLAPLVRDLIVRRSIHPATGIGFAILFAAIPVILGLSGMEGWASFLTSVLGPPAGGV
ncbi:hypothetical protein [Aquisalinus flavus]|uniref:Uncharacterized protein n=1 Tax=Aquisalinus flavus TaxID=1526572 RepID=A0A8J2V240_9PROT|nr:hypothetical protein [Aquisalinus flavus]MBD0425534.1 hypothetical protein [Aquisalinus flavus]UNE48837.1 hypothetical protein FF099_12650 [Aquisalinus flavus]GGD15305.1 hypothetical protein GCM10011342_25090 [Aquisalinus flavus]